MIRSVPIEKLPHDIRDASDARRFASSIIRARQPEDEFDARAVLSEYPELGSYDSAVLDLVYEEFSRRAESGEELDSQEFADQFPQFRSVVLEHIRAHQLLERCFGDKSPVWPETGDTVLGCELLKEIGRGAFSRVFLASQTALGGRHVVVKFCPSGAHEAHLLGKLEHEHIVQVHAVESDAERRLNAIVMPFFGRATLRDVVDCCFAAGAAPRSAGPVRDAIRRIDAASAAAAADTAAESGSYLEAVVQIMLDVARGLAHAHGKRVLHADIKPSNVLVTASLRAKLLDFNLSHDSGALTNMTGGTVPYMAPEQLLALAQQREPTPTAAADVYAFGATFFEVLTGSSPYGEIPAGMDRTSLADWLLQRRQAGWTTLAALAPRVPRPIRALVTRCLSMDPRDRPKTVDEVVAVLEREQRATVRWLRRVQRHPLVSASVGGAVAIALSAMIALIALSNPAYVDYYEQGHRELLAENYAKAVELFNLADKNLPVDAAPEDTIPLWYERGRARLRLTVSGSYDDAYRDFQHVIKLDPQHAAAHASLGYAYVIDFNYDQPVRDFTARFISALQEFEQARDLGLATRQLRYDIEFCRSHIEAERASGLVGMQQLVRTADVPDDVLASAFHALARAALAHSGEVELPLEDVRELLQHVGHCGSVFIKAGGVYLEMAKSYKASGESDTAEQSADMALACFRSALRYGASESDIEDLRNSYELMRSDPRFADIKPDGDIIPSSPEPPAALDPLASDSFPRP